MTGLVWVRTATRMEKCDDLAGWVAAARAGDTAAFERIVIRYQRLVLVISLRMLGSMEDAQDASQEVFLRLFRNLTSVHDLRNFSGWLYRVTLNVCHDFERRRRPAEALEDVGEIAAAGPDPLESMTRAERQRMLSRVLLRLPVKERAALVLHDIEGLPTREVAEILGSTEATVRSQVSKARIKLREALEHVFRRRV